MILITCLSFHLWCSSWYMIVNLRVCHSLLFVEVNARTIDQARVVFRPSHLNVPSQAPGLWSLRESTPHFVGISICSVSSFVCNSFIGRISAHPFKYQFRSGKQNQHSTSQETIPIVTMSPCSCCTHAASEGCSGSCSCCSDKVH